MSPPTGIPRARARATSDPPRAAADARFRTRGHPAALEAIAAMLVGRVPHALVLAGPPGVGKTTLALDLAAGLLCEASDPATRPCRACRPCRLVDRRTHPDLHRLAPAGPGDQIRIGSRGNPEAGTVRRLITDLALLAVEGGARVAIVERADRLNDDAQSALLKTLEEPPAGVTIVLCADEEDRLLPTVRSRSARVRLGPVGVREIEALLAETDGIDPPLAARAARLAAGRPGIARSLARRPEILTARAQVARILLDLLPAGSAARLGAAKELLGLAADVDRAVAATALDDLGGSDGAPAAGRGRGRSKAARPAAGAPGGPVDDPEPSADADAVDGEPPDAVPGGPATASAAERRRGAAVLVAIWRDLARDLALVRLGEERGVRDPGLLDDLRAVAPGVDPAALAAFLGRLDEIGELLEGNIRPDLAVDSLLLGWPAGPAGAASAAVS